MVCFVSASPEKLYLSSFPGASEKSETQIITEGRFCISSRAPLAFLSAIPSLCSVFHKYGLIKEKE